MNFEEISISEMNLDQMEDEVSGQGESDSDIPNEEYTKMYFHVRSCAPRFSEVTVCPIKFFKEKGCLADSNYFLEFEEAFRDIEDHFEEISDATYEFAGSVEAASKLLLAHGFVQDDEFDEFMDDMNSSE